MTANGTESLPANWYHDAEIFARERELIFARHWTVIARAAQISAPGDFVTGEVAGRPVFVIRDREGGLKAFHNVCRHRAGPVVRGAGGHCNQLRCPYHGWVYDLSGRLKKAPGFAADDRLELSDFNLFAVRAASWNGLVFVCLDPAAPTLEDWLGDIIGIAAGFPPLEHMRFYQEDSIEGRTNWKAYGDNSAEGYHLPHIHRDLTKSVVRRDLTIAPHANGQFVGFDVRYQSDPPEAVRPGYWIYKFPGLLLHFSERSFNLERVIPLDPGRVRLVRWFWFLADGSLPDDEMAAIVASSTTVMREDLAICEAVQRNLEAGVYQSGRLSAGAEAGTLYIQSLVRLALENYYVSDG